MALDWDVGVWSASLVRDTAVVGCAGVEIRCAEKCPLRRIERKGLVGAAGVFVTSLVSDSVVVASAGVEIRSAEGLPLRK